MSLSSVLQTALSGMSAASLTVDVAANNLANSRTAGFKANRARFATQVSTTFYGGSGPIQIGTGVRVAGVSSDFTQGAIVASANPLDLALEGDGLFIVEGESGERAYVRSGEFQLNANGEIVTASGDQLLGYGVDGEFQIDASRLEPLSIPRLGSTTASADGTAATLTGFSINQDGRIKGHYSDGVERDLGQVRVARFANPSGLEAAVGNRYRAGANSGLPVESNPGGNGAATVLSGGVELSNTDIGQNLVDLALASQQFLANAAVFRTADHLLDELVHLKRRNY